jgi:hypothetical protein
MKIIESENCGRFVSVCRNSVTLFPFGVPLGRRLVFFRIRKAGGGGGEKKKYDGY